MTILDLNAPGYTMLQWLTILLENREFDTSAPLAAEAKEYLMNTFHLDYKSADIIIGYRADDSYFSFASDFINGAISYRQLCNAMPKVSCATLETVMNLAALNSTYQGHEHIYKDDVTDALLQVVYRLSKTDKSLDLTECQKIALHEAAHAVVGEILNPDSIGIVTIRGNQSCIGGFENGCSTYLKNEEELLNDITKTLAGKAGVSLIYGVMDVNASGDIQNANRLLDLWMTSLAGAGFSEVESANNRMSETRLFSSEAIRAAKMEELYRRAYKILYDNRDFLLAVQKELLEHETLLNSDLAKIRESCT